LQVNDDCTDAKKLGNRLWTPKPSGANGVTDRAAKNAGTVFIFPCDWFLDNPISFTEAMKPGNLFWTPYRVERMA
jgi:hypothetical protein